MSAKTGGGNAAFTNFNNQFAHIAVRCLSSFIQGTVADGAAGSK